MKDKQKLLNFFVFVVAQFKQKFSTNFSKYKSENV